MVVAEAWTQRLAVAVSDIPVLRELVEDSGGGLVAGNDAASFSTAISALLDDRERTRAMGLAGYEYWRGWLTPEAVADRHLDVYAQMLQAGYAAAADPRTSS